MAKMGKILLVAVCSALSGLLFGYDAGIISGALLFIKKTFTPISSEEIGWIVAMVPIGALISSVFSGKASDIFGRKKTLFFTAVFFIVGALISALSHSIAQLILGRLIIGIAIGIGSCISPVYTSELAPEKQRGWLVNLFVVSIQLGIFLSFVVGFLLSGSGNWRAMIALGIIPAVICAFAVLFLPESPRWLVVKNKIAAAHKVLQDLFGTAKADQEIAEIKEVVSLDRVNFKVLLQEPKFFKVIFIGAAVSFFTQTVGINAFNYYAPSIFQKTGFATPSQATFYTMFMGLMLALSTISSLFFIDRIGRKRPLLIGTSGILFILLVISLSFSLIINPMVLGWIFLICAIVFMAFHGISIGPACFLIPAEIFPARVRGLGMGISVAFNWGANVIVAAALPSVIQHFGVAVLFAAFFVITIIGWLIFYFYIPETKGTTLEQIECNVLANVKSRDLGNTYEKTLCHGHQPQHGQNK